MSIWLCRTNDVKRDNFRFPVVPDDYSFDGDEVYVYSNDEKDGGFVVSLKFRIDGNGLTEISLDRPKYIDIPYSIFYKTKVLGQAIKLTNKEAHFILGKETSHFIGTKKDIKEQFKEYIKSDWPAGAKDPEKRIKYLDELFPKEINNEEPQSIFEIHDLEKLNELSKELRAGGKYHGWDREGKYVGEVLQTLNRYIKFLNGLDTNSINVVEEVIQEPKIVQDSNSKILKSFVKKIDANENAVISDTFKNIEFTIGQPNTGKSYNFEESQIFNTDFKEHYKYLKIPVSGGIGNEYKGLQNTDLAITYDPIKEEVRFGEFLQVLMSAIVNPKVPHVIFLDDFHNQDISSLLSEYTPLFKSQQMRDIDIVDESHPIFTVTEYASTDDFIKAWNTFIDSHCKNTPIVPLTNRISGESLKLVFPSNFYLLGAANFNENTLNIFADWEDRAKITYKNPIETFTLENDESGFVKCCKELNTNLRDILEKNKVFDYEKYCFGLWKIVQANGNAIDDPVKQKEIVKFLFGMIKNALRFNNKNSSINSIGWELFINMQSNDWFKSNIKTIDGTLDNIDYKILHEYNIYEDEI